jgi:hypothetical protein
MKWGDHKLSEIHNPYDKLFKETKYVISIDTIKERLTVKGRKKLMTVAEKLRQEVRIEIARKLLLKI